MDMTFSGGWEARSFSGGSQARLGASTQRIEGRWASTGAWPDEALTLCFVMAKSFFQARRRSRRADTFVSE